MHSMNAYQSKNINAVERSAILSTSEIILSINTLSEQDVAAIKSKHNSYWCLSTII